MSEEARRAPASSTRTRIVDAASRLLAEGGRSAVSTRAICDAAGVQPPTIYRLFDSKEGLLNAVAIKGFLDHMASYGPFTPSEDPIADLRTGWDQHVAFGLANPYLYSVMYGQAQVGGGPTTAAVTANSVLNELIHRIAEAGLLRVSEPAAAFAMNAAGCGTTLSLIALPADERDPALSAMIREDFIAEIVHERPAMDEPGLIGAAAALSALLGTSDALTAEEKALMQLWLGRISG